MRIRIPFYILLLLFISGCASTGSQQVSNQKFNSIGINQVELSVIKKPDYLSLTCYPLSEKAGENILWIRDCNYLGYIFLNNQIEKGMFFIKPITKKPFGMAAEFTGKVLMLNPPGFKAISIKQNFTFARET